MAEGWYLDESDSVQVESGNFLIVLRAYFMQLHVLGVPLFLTLFVAYVLCLGSVTDIIQCSDEVFCGD